MKIALILAALAIFSAPGCKKKSNADQAPAEESSCTTNSDCQPNWVCMAKKCTNPASGAVYTDPSNAVTPEKMKHHMEEVGAERDRNVEKSMDVE